MTYLKKVQKVQLISYVKFVTLNAVKKSKYDRYLLTAKHTLLTNTDEKGPKGSNAFFLCDCE